MFSQTNRSPSRADIWEICVQGTQKRTATYLLGSGTQLLEWSYGHSITHTAILQGHGDFHIRISNWAEIRVFFPLSLFFLKNTERLSLDTELREILGLKQLTSD